MHVFGRALGWAWFVLVFGGGLAYTIYGLVTGSYGLG